MCFCLEINSAPPTCVPDIKSIIMIIIQTNNTKTMAVFFSKILKKFFFDILISFEKIFPGNI